MKSEIIKLKNLGEVSAKMLAEIDIFTKEDIVNTTPSIIYKLLKELGHPVSLMMVYALQGAIMDLHFIDIPENIKNRLKNEVEELDKI